MKDLVSQNLIERVGEYSASNPIYKGLMVKQVTEEDNAQKGGKKKQKAKKAEAAEPAAE